MRSRCTFLMLLILLTGCSFLPTTARRPTETSLPARATPFAKPNATRPPRPQTTTSSTPPTSVKPQPTLSPTPTPATQTVTAQECPPPAALPVDSSPATDFTPAAAAAMGQPWLGTAPRFDSYTLQLQLQRATATVRGTMAVTVTNRTDSSLTELVFHLYPNLADFGGRLEVGCAAVAGIPVTPSYQQNRWIMRLPLAVPLAPQHTTVVSLSFTTNSPHQPADVPYGAFGDQGAAWSLASFYPILARYRADGWDTLLSNGWGDYVNSDMAHYVVAVASDPAAGQLIATGVQQGTCTTNDCMVVFTTGLQREFALVQAQGWQQRRATVGATTIVSSFPPAELDAGQKSLQLAADAVTKYNEHFGAYPYTELDLLPVGATTFAGVEYPGLIMISTAYYEQANDPRFDLQDVVVHEVAHQWWYNVVGNDVVREAWLDEGLTSYTAEYLYTEWSGQGSKPVTTSRKLSLERQGLAGTPLNQPMAAFASNRAYVAVIYGEAPLFLAELRTEIGDERFFQLLRHHYEQNQFGVVTTGRFQTEAETSAGRSLASLYAAWFLPLQP